MGRFNTEFFIARRISSAAGGRKNVMVRIASVTVAVGMAVMIISLAVIGGFKKEITDKLVGFEAHVRITNLDGNSSFETSPVTVDTVLMEAISAIPYFKSINTYAVKGGILKTGDAIQGIALKGVPPEYDFSFFEESMVEGRVPEISHPSDSVQKREILVSRTVADMLGLGIDDRVEALFTNNLTGVRRDQFKVCGIYSTGMEDLDKLMTVTDIRNVQRRNGWRENQVSGYEVMTTDFARAREFGDEVYGVVFDLSEDINDIYKVEDIMSLNPNVFDWLGAHNVIATVIIVIMMIVALLNMISAMLIILLEKTSMIGVLKALGMRNWSIQKIFLYRSLRIILTGMIYGNLIGITLSLLQKYTGLVKLDSAGYILSQVPISIDWQWLVGLNLGVPAVMLILLALPAMIISLVKPDRTMRYQ